MSAAHILSQDFDDLELIILDNSDGRDLTTAEFRDRRCKVIPTTAVLSMRDNWERSLDVATGKYLLLLSDKDMLLPSALRRLSAAIAAVDADMVNYRKACFAQDGAFQSFIQRCSGSLFERRSETVLRAWFDNVAHYHDAPMAYNSAVRLRLLHELKSINGTFFTGTSPDIGSGLVLAARLHRYHVLDRPLVVSWYGEWSIGMAASQGEQGAAAAFFSEYREDPIRSLGLLPGVSGSVAETLLACKQRFASLFKPYRLRWSSYVTNALVELRGRGRPGIDHEDERQFLTDTNGKQYNWLELKLGQSRYWWLDSDLSRRFLKRLARLRPKAKSITISALPSVTNTTPANAAPVEQGRQAISAYMAVPSSSTGDFRGIPYIPLPWATSVNDVIEFSVDINRYLDDQLAR